MLIVELHALGFNDIGDPRECLEVLRDGGAIVTDVGGGPVTALDQWTDRIATVQIEARWPAV